MRLFVALEPGAEDRAALSAWGTAVAAADPALRPIAAARLHLTLAFLGEVADPAPPSTAVHDSAATPGPLAVTRALWLPAGRPRVLAAAVTGAVEHVHDEVWEMLIGAGFSREDRPFQAHISVARVRGRPRTLTVPEPEPRSLQVDAITLFRSVQGPEAARYEVVARRTVG